MAEFGDLSLSPRARDMALWLCDLANPALDARSQAASAEYLLRELPDHWTEEDAVRMAREIRRELGPRASRRAWLDRAGWLVGEREQLPEKPPNMTTEAVRMRVRDICAKALAAMGEPQAKPSGRTDAERAELAAWAQSVVAAVRKQGHRVEVQP